MRRYKVIGATLALALLALTGAARAQAVAPVIKTYADITVSSGSSGTPCGASINQNRLWAVVQLTSATAGLVARVGDANTGASQGEVIKTDPAATAAGGATEIDSGGVITVYNASGQSETFGCTEGDLK